MRDIEFREPMQAAILANRRRVPPFGLHGGQPGSCGRNYVVRAEDGKEYLFPAIEEVVLEVNLERKEIRVQPQEWV